VRDVLTSAAATADALRAYALFATATATATADPIHDDRCGARRRRVVARRLALHSDQASGGAALSALSTLRALNALSTL